MSNTPASRVKTSSTVGCACSPTCRCGDNAAARRVLAVPTAVARPEGCGPSFSYQKSSGRPAALSFPDLMSIESE